MKLARLINAFMIFNVLILLTLICVFQFNFEFNMTLKYLISFFVNIDFVMIVIKKVVKSIFLLII